MNENRHRSQSANEMSQSGEHLTANEISSWLVEGPEPASDRHMQSCDACRGRLAEAQGPLTAFRTALVGWSEAQADSQSLTVLNLVQGKEQRLGFRLWLPAVSVALATMLLVGYANLRGVFHDHSGGQHQVALTSASDSDAMLLDQVDIEVSESVPDAMAPLTDLVAWDSNSSSQATPIPDEKPVVHKKSAATTKSRSKLETAN